jgi:hypothetical protein
MASTIFLTIGFALIAVLGIGVRLLFIKNGEVRGTCASQSPLLNKDNESCQLCGKPAGEACGMEDKNKG